MGAAGQDQPRSASGTSRADRLLGTGLPAAATFVAAMLLILAVIGMGRIDVVPPDWQIDGSDAEPEPVPTMERIGDREPPWTEEITGEEELPDLSVIGQILTILLVVLGAVVLIAILRRLRRLRTARRHSVVVGGDPDVLPDHSEELRDAVETASEALTHHRHTGSDAVIAAWSALESAAAESGVARDPAQTPSEFTAHLLQRHHADAAATTRLRDLYHRARFSTHPDIGADEIEAARHALDDILRTLATPARTGT
ncbi:DUF4129 domain-containing protein [Actinobacteria bacterium YIM 96077]|uniref:Protein-glutamine gamma-glutamyltransferase-like C-terminal domain-containing protein n=1 Tax=Phytoactinopolyspora halophila TaxID=1981511 RepID=A0A329QC34_9ACTN|nr:DUF4129 domain-containing protein [Phytoactinopolyspora halophila]AYY14104.1 DUF4129 domain-containing protein [Actinobacteria bacterium YIM 96077]RAW09960.1 hypothetical protein DPM12_19955 [Phytoactinopolyspora halophila]